MASLQNRNGSFRILFRYQGTQHTLTLGKVDEDEAEGKAAQVDYLLMRLRQRLAFVPEGMGIVAWLECDGRPESLPPAPAPPEPKKQVLTLKLARERYLATHEASLEATTIESIRTHFRHLERVFGEKFELPSLTLADLQRYVDKRAKAKGIKGRKLSPATIQKEVVTLRAAWFWLAKSDEVPSRFPNSGLRYPKGTEKPPFMTRKEIERRISFGGLSEAEEADLWEALYLTVEELPKVLKLVKEQATQPFIYPMVCFAGHTGARRSEIVRAKLADLDLDDDIVTIHEKKRVRGKITTRRVPISPFLKKVLREWLKVHPGGQFLFSQSAIIPRSKKRSETTGHQSQGSRKTTLSGRMEGVSQRKLEPVASITPDEAHDHLKRTLVGTNWERIRGWHVFRHSFVSACASRGIDQRLVETWAGHMSKEMSRRYAHLYPSTQQQALAKVFG